MSVRAGRMVRVASGASPDLHRGSRCDSGRSGPEGSILWVQICVAGQVVSEFSAGLDFRQAGYEGPHRVTRGTTEETGGNEP
jgi:hypothetical protein